MCMHHFSRPIWAHRCAFPVVVVAVGLIGSSSIVVVARIVNVLFIQFNKTPPNLQASSKKTQRAKSFCRQMKFAVGDLDTRGN